MELYTLSLTTCILNLSPSFTPLFLTRLVVGEQVNEAEGHTTEEMLDYIEEKELKANTQMLEIIGRLGDIHKGRPQYSRPPPSLFAPVSIC